MFCSGSGAAEFTQLDQADPGCSKGEQQLVVTGRAMQRRAKQRTSVKEEHQQDGSRLCDHKRVAHLVCLGHHNDGRSGCVDSSLSLSLRHTLHPMHPVLKLEHAVNIVPWGRRGFAGENVLRRGT